MPAGIRQRSGRSRRWIAVVVLGAMVAACESAPPKPAPFLAVDCFGDVAYSFAGWTHEVDFDPPVSEPVYAMITVDEVSLGTSPIQADGSYDVIRARAVCVARDGLVGGLAKRAFGPSRRIHVVP